MLSDRDYMKSSRPAVNKTDPMKILFGIIVINALMYIIVPKPQISEGLVWIPKAYKELVLSWPGLKDGNFWQLVSSMFMHADFWHLGFNMYGLYLFGSLFVRSVGTKHFLWLYMISGVFGNMLWLMANYHSQGFLLGQWRIIRSNVGGSNVRPQQSIFDSVFSTTYQSKNPSNGLCCF